jgi:hypothetical protein
MKKLPLLLLPLLFFGCNENADILLRIPFRDLDFALPAGLNPVETWYRTFERVPTDIRDVMEANGLDPDGNYRITPVGANLIARFGDQELDFLQEVAVYLCDQEDTSPRCGPEAFYRFPIPQDIGTVVELVPNNNVLNDLLLEERINVQILMRFDAPPVEFTDLRLEMEFKVQ